MRLDEIMESSQGSPADRGSADAYYDRARKPHKMVDGREVFDLTPDEVKEYNAAYDSETDRKDWD